MARPDGLTDEQWDEVLESKSQKVLEEMSRKRILTQGFEISDYHVEPGQKCERATSRKIKNRFGVEPCGKPATVYLDFAGPQNPKGTRVLLCRSCLAALVKDLVGYLEYSD